MPPKEIKDAEELLKFKTHLAYHHATALATISIAKDAREIRNAVKNRKGRF